MALGIFDADGAVLLKTYFRNNSVFKNTLGFQVCYSVCQSLSKIDTVHKFATRFGKNVTRTECRMSRTSPAGQRFRQLLLNNKPKHPDRRRDFLISEQIFQFLCPQSGKKLTTIQSLVVAFLVSQKSVLLNQGGSQEYFDRCCLHLQATEVKIQEALVLAREMSAKINGEIETFQQELPTMELSDDYVRGVHFGDGSFYVALSWKPTEKAHRLRCEPEWAMSGYKKAYCEAFANKYGGITKKVDAAGQIKFVLSGIKKCSSVVTLFENSPWVPQYKQEQFERWKTSLTLLKNQEHFTEEGIVRLLDFTYGLAEKGARKYSKEQYLEWGCAWLNNSSRQKRKPRENTSS
jgi:hypothetical protein